MLPRCPLDVYRSVSQNASTSEKRMNWRKESNEQERIINSRT